LVIFKVCYLTAA